jgi:RNA polymerase sigma-70 factor (ECF subfamily)
MIRTSNMPTPPLRETIDLDRMIAEFRPKVGFKVKRSLGFFNPDWEDITNEVLAQAVEKIQSGEFRGDSAVGTFIYTITVRRIVDYIRQKTRVLRQAPEPESPADPLTAVATDEEVERLARAVKGLKPKYREVLELYYYRQYSREETARRLRITPSKVSERANYARKLLKRKLGG